MKFLALVNGLAMAHVTRAMEIGKSLRARGHWVGMAGDGAYMAAAAWEGFESFHLPFVDRDVVQRATRSGRFWEIFPTAVLAGHVASERELIRRLRPDLLLVDNRPTVFVSAELEGVPTVSVFNVHYSRFRKIPFLAVHRLPGPRAVIERLERAENQVEFLFWEWLMMRGFTKLRKKLGLAPRHAYGHEEGDLNLLADIPEFNPAVALPVQTHFVGPLAWHSPFPPPACLNRLDPGRPVIYFTIGSVGQSDLLASLTAFSRRGIQVVAASGQESSGAASNPAPGVFIERFVNADALLPRCQAVVCHGGNGTLYQAFSHGVPVVVVANHAEQAYGGRRVVDLGAGIALHANQVKKRGAEAIVDSVERVLSAKDFTVQAGKLRDALRPWNGAERAADLIEGVFSGREPTPL